MLNSYNNRCFSSSVKISIAEILAISVVSVIDLTDAFAKKSPTPDFEAKLQGKQQTVPEERGTGHGKASFWFTEINGEDNPDIADKYKVEGYPTIKLIKGSQIIEYDAKPSLPHLTEFLQSTLN